MSAQNNNTFDVGKKRISPAIHQKDALFRKHQIKHCIVRLERESPENYVDATGVVDPKKKNEARTANDGVVKVRHSKKSMIVVKTAPAKASHTSKVAPSNEKGGIIAAQSDFGVASDADPINNKERFIDAAGVVDPKKKNEARTANDGVVKGHHSKESVIVVKTAPEKASHTSKVAPIHKKRTRDAAGEYLSDQPNAKKFAMDQQNKPSFQRLIVCMECGEHVTTTNSSSNISFENHLCYPRSTDKLSKCIHLMVDTMTLWQTNAVGPALPLRQQRQPSLPLLPPLPPPPPPTNMYKTVRPALSFLDELKNKLSNRGNVKNACSGMTGNASGPSTRTNNSEDDDLIEALKKRRRALCSDDEDQENELREKDEDWE